MWNRREFLQVTGASLLTATGCARVHPIPGGVDVNDIHSKLNPTRVREIVPVDTLDAARKTLRRASRSEVPISIAGGRHAMGGQQFGTDMLLLDTTPMNRVLDFDRERGIVEVEAGIRWPELLAYLHREQQGQVEQWGIAQKQTGADRLAVGGAVSANIHSRGLKMKPFVSNVESVDVLDANGKLIRCSRSENHELFRLVFGGYGLFGLVYSVRLQLVPRQKIERQVEVINVDDLLAGCEKRIASGFIYGDFQFMTDSGSADFLRRGIFSCYRPVPVTAEREPDHGKLLMRDWEKLIYLAHADKARAYQSYIDYYLSTSGQIYWSDTHQLSTYRDDYHALLDQALGATVAGSEMITEAYVPRERLAEFMAKNAADFREHNVNVIYGTIRLIERDDESFLAWAREPWACVIFNLHVDHSTEGIERAKADFRRIIDRAIECEGTYYLTYHRWATREQVLACYPQFPEFLRLKRHYDPQERFQSDWYRHYARMFGKSA
jgi:FAD/FMN-containing dehydrogenase